MKRQLIYNEKLTNYLRVENARKTKERQSSGKISPTKLTKPTLEAVLQLLGVQADPPNDKSLRNFLRGNTLEGIAIKAIKGRRQTDKVQVAVSYRNGIGYADCIEKVPHEIKAPGAYGYKMVIQNDAPKHDHCIQATWYALGTNSKSAWIHYISSEGYQKETYEISSFKINANDYAAEVNRRIDLIHAAFISGNLPDFEPLEEFHDRIIYSDYSMFHNKKGVQAENILEQYYPQEFKKLKSGELIERIIGSDNK